MFDLYDTENELKVKKAICLIVKGKVMTIAEHEELQELVKEFEKSIETFNNIMAADKDTK